MEEERVEALIAVCKCPGMPKYATDAFSTLFPGEIHPEMVVGRQILDESNRYPNTQLGEFLLALSKNKEKFAVYIVHDGNRVIEYYDLKKGIRIC